MREYKITTNMDVFFVRALSEIHARQVAGKKLREGEWIEAIEPV